MDTRLKRILAQLNLANQLTFLRLVLIPFFILALLNSRFGLALLLFGVAALTDLLDGISARLLGGTQLGAYLDPAADKLLLFTAFIMLTDYPVMLQRIPYVARIPLWLTVLGISRDVLIVGISVLLYLSRSHSRFPPSVWGKLTTAMELITVCCFLLANWLGEELALLRPLVWASFGFILISGFHYLGRTIRELSHHVSK